MIVPAQSFGGFSAAVANRTVALHAAFTFVAFGLLVPTPTAAHQRSVSYSSWQIRGTRAQVTVRLSRLEVSRFPWVATAGRASDERLGEYLSTHLRLFAGKGACVVAGGPRRLSAAPGRVVFEWDLRCPRAGEHRIVSDLLLEVAPSHLHFARVRLAGSPPIERVLSEADTVWVLGDAARPAPEEAHGASLVDYVRLGVKHILTGYDHLAFLLALLLIETSVAEVATIVTGFTIGHSLTLALAILGYVRPEPAAIEALIGLSIVLVAAENAWLLGGRPRLFPWLLASLLGCSGLAAVAGYGRVPGLTLGGLAFFSICYFGLLHRVARIPRLRWFVAFLFGLVHGFGFAGILTEARLPADRLVSALFGFNVGVELGQLGMVLMVWPFLWLVNRPGRQGLRRAVVQVGSAAVCGLGVFWYISRAYG